MILFAPKAYGLAESTGPDGSNAQAVHQLGETGRDVNVGLIASRNILTTHEAFYDKDSNGLPVGATHAFNHDCTGSGTQVFDHDTWMAGIVASRGGVSHPNDVGAAPGANIHSARILDAGSAIYFHYIAGALDKLVTDHNCRVIVTGLDLSPDPNGQSQCTLLYDYYACQHNVVFANAAGNSNTVITVFGDAYNGITTGGLIVTTADVYDKVGILSGSGPTSDGRRKPDVTAPSQRQIVPTSTSDTAWTDPNWVYWAPPNGYTSLSAPHVAGVAALLLGLADDTPEPNDGHNEVIKAVIVNSTFPNVNDKSGNSTNPADVNNIWHKDRGYGRVDALRAYELLNAGRASPGEVITQPKGWAFDTIAAQQQHTYTIAAQKNHRLLATLTWNRRIEWDDSSHNGEIDDGELSSHPADLDLRIYEPSGPNVIFSEQNNGLDPNDNLEKCDILLAADGNYILKIVNDSDNKETADYGFALELLPPTPGDFEPVDYIVDYSDVATLARQWLLVGPGLVADLIGDDNTVNMRDFAKFVTHWLVIDPAYYRYP